MRRQLNPYAPAEVLQALGREYKVGSFGWSSSQSTNDLVGALNFPEALFAIPFIRDKIKGYRFFASKVAIKIVLQCTAFQYGGIVWATQPDIFDTVMGLYTQNIFQTFGNYPKVSLAQASKPLEFELPWMQTNQYMDLPSHDYDHARIGRIEGRVFLPLATSGLEDTGDVTVTVLARFINPELAMYDPEVELPPIPLNRRRKIVGQMDVGSLASIGDLPQTAIESAAKMLHNTVDVAKEAVSTAASIFGPIFTNVVSPLIGLFGLSKPLISSPLQRVVQSNLPHLPHANGVSEAIRLSHTTTCELSIEGNITGPEGPHIGIYDIARRPSLILIASDDNTGHTLDSAVAQWIVNPALPVLVTGTTYLMTYSAQIARLFRWWRGGMKYKILFCASSFMSARYVITHSFEPPALITDNLGDMVGMIVDVKGNTEVDFFVPYLSKQHSLAVPDISLPIANYGGSGYVTIYRITNIQSSNQEADPPIQIAVFSAAGEDMRFIQRRGFRTTIRDYFHASKPAAIVGQCDILTDFRKPFQGLNPAAFSPEARFLCGEDYGTVREFCHRPQLSSTTGADGAMAIRPKVWPDATGSKPFFGHVDYLAHMFRFWRGSMRCQIASSAASGFIYFGLPMSDIGEGATVDAGDYVSGGGVVADGTTGPSISNEIPWYWSEPIRPIQDSAEGWFNPATSTNYMRYGSSPAATVLRAVSVGEDFQMGTFKPPLYYTLPPAASQKQVFISAVKALAQKKDSSVVNPVESPSDFGSSIATNSTPQI